MSINLLLFLSGLLLLLGIVSSKFASRLGMPVLVLFLAVGMVAGSEGIGQIAFENYELANSIGSVALALILFDGGLRTTLEAVRASWRPALVLATFGVLLTSALTGLAATTILKVSWLHGMLLGSIIGSTDAAAVFSVLRTSGLKLPERLVTTLEVESGSNDPMAIFLTLGLIGIITGTLDSPGALGLLFVQQFGVGTVVGVLLGLGAGWAINRFNLDHAGLYPIVALAFGLLSFGVAAVLGGSGFLAVYLSGIVLGSRIRVFRNGIFAFHDAAAWLSQIVLFVMLGLLSFPSRLWAVAPQGFLLALVLVLAIRPLVVVLSLLPFGLPARAQAFIAWAGLKGAVPITLATFPLTAGVEGSELLFNVVFFAVLISAITQGWSLPVVARALKLGRPADPAPPLSVEINALRDVDGDITEYTVDPRARVVGHCLRDIALPDGVVVALLLREGAMVMPRGATTLHAGDHLFVVARKQIAPFVAHLFDARSEPVPLPDGLTLDFQASDSGEQIRRFFDLPGPRWPEQSIGTLAATPMAQLGPFRLTPSREPGFVTLTHLRPPEADGSQATLPL